jgi:predicted Zn-dependent peptidase
MYHVKKLANGTRLLLAPITGTGTVTALVMVATGSKYETKQNSGISHFLEHMFFKGTQKRPSALALSSELDSLGGVYNAFTTKEFTGYWAKVDASQSGKALDVLSDMLLSSLFVAEEIEREKGVIIEELNMYLDNPMIHIEDLFENLLYGDQPAGWDIIGTKETIQSFKREDFISYVQAQYGAQNTVICLAGNIPVGIEQVVEASFAKLATSEAKDKLAATEEQSAPACLSFYKKTDQAHLSLGVRAYPSGHPDEFILRLLSTILGGSMSSRLFINLREREGLAYYVRTNAEYYTDTGYLTTQAGVPVDKAEKAIGIIMSEYRRLREELVPAEELERVKDMIRGRLVIQTEASDNVANWYAKQAVMKEAIMTPEDYIKAISAVTAEDIRRVATDIFTNKGLNLAIIGPYEGEKEFLPILTF